MRKIISIRGEASELSILPDAQTDEILKNLRGLRKSKGLTQKEVAKRLDISSVQYGNLENGRNNLLVKQLFRIIEVLDVSLNDVFSFPEVIPDNIKAKVDELKTELNREREVNRLAFARITELETENKTLKRI